MTPVQKVLADLASGTTSMSQAAARISSVIQPAVRRRPATSPHETYQRMLSDELPPETPGSWDDVNSAYVALGQLTYPQFKYLYDHVRRPSPHWIA